MPNFRGNEDLGKLVT